MVEGRSRELWKDRGGGWDRLQAAYRYGGGGRRGRGWGVGRTWLAVGMHTGKGEAEA